MADSDSEEGLTREEMQQQEEVEPPPKRAKQDACTFSSSFISSHFSSFTLHLSFDCYEKIYKISLYSKRIS